MAKQPGTCFLCEKTYTGRGINSHLKSCRTKHPIGLDYGDEMGIIVKRKIYHLEATGRYWNDYWMHLEVSSNNTLKELDLFLRGIWLECCGHLSSFKIGNTTHFEELQYYDDWDNVAGMDITLNKLHLYEGLDINYEYDFGSTTELWLKIHKIEEVEIKGKTLYVIARNDTPAQSARLFHAKIPELRFVESVPMRAVEFCVRNVLKTTYVGKRCCYQL